METECRFIRLPRRQLSVKWFEMRQNEALQIKKSLGVINLLKSIGYVMHQQFNIQQLYALPTLYLCVLYLSENKQRLVPLSA